MRVQGGLNLHSRECPSVCRKTAVGVEKWLARKVARLPRRVAESTPRPKGRWVCEARRHALPACGSDIPRRFNCSPCRVQKWAGTRGWRRSAAKDGKDDGVKVRSSAWRRAEFSSARGGGRGRGGEVFLGIFGYQYARARLTIGSNTPCINTHERCSTREDQAHRHNGNAQWQHRGCGRPSFEHSERFASSVSLSHQQVRRARARRRTICSPERCSARVGVGEGAGVRGN